MKKILVNTNPWQTRVAVLRNDRLQDIYFDTHTKINLERCFFKGRIAKVLPGIQTTFVDFKQERAGFLHITEVDRVLAADRIAEQTGEHTDARRIKHKMDIGKVFREGEDVLIQVLKEPVHEKGAKLTTCFTLPGRYVVLMPNISQVGISKKIDDRDERSRLRDILQRKLPDGMGAIIRTTAEHKSEQDITRDIAFQINIWKSIKRKFTKAEVGEKIHEDLPMALRVVRDHLSTDVDVVITDNKEVERSLAKFIKNFNPDHLDKLKTYK